MLEIIDCIHVDIISIMLKLCSKKSHEQVEIEKWSRNGSIVISKVGMCMMFSQCNTCSMVLYCNTVEPPIVDPPTKGHNIIDLSIKDTGQGPKNLFAYSSNTF